MYKPGQFIWFKGIRYRITRSHLHAKLVCVLCSRRHRNDGSCKKLCGNNMPRDCYPRLDPIKSKLKRGE